MMRPGLLRQRLAIEAVAGSTDDHGGIEPTYAAVETRWGSVEPLSGRELVVARQTHPEASHEIRIRFMRALTPKHRISWRNPRTGRTHLFNILSVADTDSRGYEMVILASERVPVTAPLIP